MRRLRFAPPGQDDITRLETLGCRPSSEHLLDNRARCLVRRSERGARRGNDENQENKRQERPREQAHAADFTPFSPAPRPAEPIESRVRIHAPRSGGYADAASSESADQTRAPSYPARFAASSTSAIRPLLPANSPRT